MQRNEMTTDGWGRPLGDEREAMSYGEVTAGTDAGRPSAAPIRFTETNRPMPSTESLGDRMIRLARTAALMHMGLVAEEQCRSNVSNGPHGLASACDLFPSDSIEEIE